MPNAFIALRPDADTRDRLSSVAGRLRAWDLPARWVHAEDYHLTVAFLGALDETERSFIPHAVDPVAGAVRAPRLRLAGLAAAGGHTVPQRVFVALEDAAGAVAELHRDLAEALAMDADAAFRSRVTLCRPLPAGRAVLLFRDWPHLLEAHGLADWGPFVAEDLALLVSDPASAPRHRLVARWPLIRA